MTTKKQRSFMRYEIKLIATLVVNNTNFIQCMIRDFCSGGLFLQPLSLDGIESLKPLQTKRIIFSVDLGHGGNDFSLDAKIMHIREHGIGVEFESHSEAAFDALKKEAENTLGLRLADRRTPPEILSIQKTLDVDLDNLFNKELPAVVDRFYQCLNEAPLESIETLKKQRDKATLKKSITNLEKNKTALLKDFCSSFKGINYLPSSVSEQYDEVDKKTILSVFDNNQFEDWLNILAIIRNLESINHTQLNQLQKKFLYVANVKKNTTINPVSPGNLCDCFRNLIGKYEHNSSIQSVFYAVFEKTLLEFLPALYEQMDNILVEHGAPVKIDKTTNWTKDNHNSEPSDTISSHSIKSVTDLPSIPNPAFSSKNSSYQSELLHQLQERKLSEQKTTSHSDNISVYSTEEIKSAFSDFQKETLSRKNPQHSSVLLKINLLEDLKKSSSTTKQLSNKDLNNLEVYGCLFEIIFKKLLTNHKIKQYLHSIYIPIIYHAMQDPSFLETDKNPARAILNHLFWLETALLDNVLLKKNQSNESLEQLMEQLSKYSLNHSSTFIVVEQQLNEITNPVKKAVEKNILRVTKEYQDKQKLINAQQSVEEEFNRRHLTDQKIPNILCTLLDAGWQHLLVLAKLNDDNNAFQSHLRIIINLNAWLSGPEKANKEQIESTLKFIDIQLQTVCANSLLHDKILRELTLLLLNLNGLLPNSDTMHMVSFKKNKSTQACRKRNVHLDYVNQLKTGEWFTFLLKREPESLKLVCVNDAHKIFVFVNRSGIKKAELTKDELLDLMGRGVALRIENQDIPLVDRAISLMLQEMHKKNVSNAIYNPLTHLLNKDIFIKQLKRELKKPDNAQHLLCNLQIQDFNIITEDCGLVGADALLKKLADTLKLYLREEEMITQLDDKTFTIFLKNCPVDAAYNVAKKLQSKLIATPFIWRDRHYSIAVNIGIVPLSTTCRYDIVSLLQKMNTITFSAVKAGSNSIQIHKEKNETTSFLNGWNGQIFNDYGFFILCQKIVALDPEQNNHSHYKMLLGIKDKSNNLIKPGNFVQGVENPWSVSEIDRLIILTVFSWIEQHQSFFKTIEGISIGLSAESIKNEGFFDFLNHLLSANQIVSNKITFEISETVATENFLMVQEFIKKVKRFKCKFALNDFGSNYSSSHSFLKSLDIDYLIIANELIKNIDKNAFDVTIVKSLITIAKSLGLETIVESVENSNIHKILSEINIDYCQGTEIKKPTLLTELVEN
jgi:diguanylate cyclase (GGDEF)-like protein